jgi:hypothetical protein
MTDLDTQIQDIMSRRLERLPSGEIDPELADQVMARAERSLRKLEGATERLERLAADAEARGPGSSPRSSSEPRHLGLRCRRCQGVGAICETRDGGLARVVCPDCDGEGTDHVR